MKNNFDLRKFLAEGSFANRPKQINENFNEEEDKEVRYDDPCERIENQLMDLYDKHGENMISMFRRMSNAENSGDKRIARVLYFKFIKVTAFIKISNLNMRYNRNGCGDAEEFAKDYFGMDSWRDLYESTDVNEGLGTFFGSAFRWIQGKGEASMAEGDYNEGEYNEEIEEEVNESAADVQELIIGLLGTGGMAAATIGISKLMDALESGQHGEHGKKVAQALKKLGNAAAKSRNVSEEEVEESAPGFAHDCAAHVVHEVYGYGLCLEGQHTLVETTKGRAKVTHYDVLFKNGTKIVENIPVEELQIESIEEHTHSKKK